VGVLPGVLTYTQPQQAARVHQTQKPLDLMRQIVRITAPGGTILDPFAGSGTTLLAAALEGYDAIGVELSDAYYAAALERLGQEARR
jgi:site-specific DNA-methyltransferase (adenine-specific)